MTENMYVDKQTIKRLWGSRTKYYGRWIFSHSGFFAICFNDNHEIIQLYLDVHYMPNLYLSVG